MELQPHLLLIEDDPDTADLMVETLEDHFGRDCTEVVGTCEAARAADLDKFDLVLSDMNLPDGAGIDLLGPFLQRREDLPIVFVTAEGVLDRAIECIRRGAFDYVVKAGDYLFAIPVIVEKNLALAAVKEQNRRLQQELRVTLDELQTKNEQLAHAASTDPLTGLANRRAMAEALDSRFAEAQRKGHDLAIMMIDLDGFKGLNDTLGHPMGDRMLERCAKVLRANCRQMDVPGRFGGDEFVVVLPQTTPGAAKDVAMRIHDQFEHAAALEFGQLGYDGKLSMSIGLSTLSEGRAPTPEDLLQQADGALYRAKAQGKSQACVWDAAAA